MVEGNQRLQATGCEESYEPIVPMKVGNHRATEVCGGHGTHWREGENKRTHRMGET